MGIVVPSLGSRFRRWTTEYYIHMSKKNTFRDFCLKVTAITDQHSNSSCARKRSLDATDSAKADNETEEQKNVQGQASIQATWSKVLDIAKFRGQEDSVWERMVRRLLRWHSTTTIQ